MARVLPASSVPLVNLSVRAILSRVFSFWPRPSSTGLSRHPSMNSSSVYHHHDVHLPPSFIDHHRQLSDLLLGRPPVSLVGSQQAPPNTLFSRNGEPSSCRMNGEQPARKDRHSKILTAQGLRDRRVRLSIGIARRFFDLQDMLGFDKASKTVEWLLRKSRVSIKKLARTKHIADPDEATLSPSSNSSDSSSSGASSFTSFSSKVVSRKGKKDKDKLVASNFGVPARDQFRAKVRARARERTREKLINCQIRAPSAQVEGDAQNLLFSSQSHNDDAATERGALSAITKQSMETGRKLSSILGHHHENLVISSSNDWNNFNGVESFFSILHPQWSINGAIDVNLTPAGNWAF